MPEMNTVTIPLEEYIDLRRKAEENLYLATKLGAFEDKLYTLADQVRHLEQEMQRLKNQQDFRILHRGDDDE